MAVDVGARAVVDGYLRPGSCGTGHRLEGFIRKLMAGVAGEISKIKKWRAIGDGHFTANIY
ncbi:MAG: hypothetical protein WHT06_03185 [Desulfobacterales bacterium]